MYYTIYKTTNKINGKIYVGVHKTDNLDDGYIGSGKLLQRAIGKYGIENFKKEILKVFKNSDDMYEAESLLVTEDFIQKNNNYNIKKGGEGGFDFINASNDIKQKKTAGKKGGTVHKNKLKNDLEYAIMFSKEKSITMKKTYDAGKFKNRKGFLGKFHTEETKKKISESHKGKHIGSKNSQFGTIWIYNLNLEESKKIKIEDFPCWEENGWIKGRKMNFTVDKTQKG